MYDKNCWKNTGWKQSHELVQSSALVFLMLNDARHRINTHVEMGKYFNGVTIVPVKYVNIDIHVHSF